MLYLGNASSPAVRDAMATGEIGMMVTPARVWAADNGCFGAGYPGDDAWTAWLARLQRHTDRCLFATAPDVVADAAATLLRSAPHLPVIRRLGYPAALVAQDGLEHLRVPWAHVDVLFLGVSTGWKLGPGAAELTAEALVRGKPVHMGRVNSARRWNHALRIGCASVDGTCLTYAPDANLARIRRWALPAPIATPGAAAESTLGAVA